MVSSLIYTDEVWRFICSPSLLDEVPVFYLAFYFFIPSTYFYSLIFKYLILSQNVLKEKETQYKIIWIVYPVFSWLKFIFSSMFKLKSLCVRMCLIQI